MSTDIFELEDKARLELTQNTRDKIIRTLTADGKLPEDTSSREFLMKALDGMDRAVFTKSKIKAEDKLAQGQQQTAKTIAELLTRMSVKQGGGSRRTSTDLSDDIKVDNLVKDETAIGLLNIDLNEIIPPEEQ